MRTRSLLLIIIIIIIVNWEESEAVAIIARRSSRAFSLEMADHVNNDEAERLLSRVNQQSTLIEMLKERADKTQKEVRKRL